MQLPVGEMLGRRAPIIYLPIDELLYVWKPLPPRVFLAIQMLFLSDLLFWSVFWGDYFFGTLSIFVPAHPNQQTLIPTKSGCGGLVFLPKSPEMSDNPSYCTIHMDHNNSHQFCTFYSVLDEIGTKMIISNVSVLFLSLLSCTHFHFQQRLLTHTHSLTHTAPHSHSLCLSLTRNKETHQQASISFWEWKINQFLSFFFINNSVSRFGSHRRQLGWCPNSRQIQFLGIFFVFSTLIISLNELFISIQYICLIDIVFSFQFGHKTFTCNT